MFYFFAAAKDGDITSGTICADSMKDAEKHALMRAALYHSREGVALDQLEGELDGFHCYEVGEPFQSAYELLASLKALRAQIVETSAYDDARRGEDPGLINDVLAADLAIARATAQAVQS